MQPGQQQQVAGQQQQPGNVVPPPQGNPAETHATPPQANPPNSQVQQDAGAQAQPTSQQPTQDPQGGQARGGNAGAGGGRSGEQVFTVSQSAFKRLKDEARQKGASAAVEELAKENGYSSVEEMQAALKGKRQGSGDTRRPKRRPRRSSVAQPATDAASPEGGDGDGVDVKAFQRQLRRMEKRLNRQAEITDGLSKGKLQAERRAKGLKAERDALEAEMAIREMMARQGVRDTDYAMRLYTRAQQGKSEEELAKFNHEEYFAKTLRTEHPYIYGELQKPATTGNGSAGTNGSPPNPGAAGTGAAAGGKVDVKTMSPEDYRKHLASRNLNLAV